LSPPPIVSAIVAAGGRGQRFGAPAPKQLLLVAGRSILERSVGIFLAHPAISEVVVALPAEMLADPPAYLRAARKPLHLVAGGVRRQDSVWNAFQMVSEAADLVVVHDAARPFATADLVSRTIAAAAESGVALAALPAKDTVKRSEVAAEAKPRRLMVAETLPRDEVFLAQTPQVFRRQILREALALGASGVDATDEATLAERTGAPVRLVAGEPTNIKITTPDDLPLAEAIAHGAQTVVNRTAPAPVSLRVGVGYDLHRLVAGRRLVLAGVMIPFDKGLLGHSDADVIAHAVTDAVLGAAGAGDIGMHFPDTDPAWRDANSIDLLKRAVAVVHGHGYRVGNVDVVVIAERPKLGGYLEAMRANLAGALGTAATHVSVKGKTNEGVGEIGAGDAIAVHAVAVIHAR
jgi:2-C-methyl-D-erythritol 4-phosphate cytidylyltransferase/2-C-methyl-D-erythritol 2,4-cyclodiphosphate synthase